MRCVSLITQYYIGCDPARKVCSQGFILAWINLSSLQERLALIKQQLGQAGLHIALNMKYDLTSEWLLLKSNGTVSLTIDKARLPYMAQAFDVTIENVMLVAKVKNNPANFAVQVDGATLNLARVDEWKLCRGNSAAVELDTAFDLSVASLADLNNLEELMLLVKYSF